MRYCKILTSGYGCWFGAKVEHHGKSLAVFGQRSVVVQDVLLTGQWMVSAKLTHPSADVTIGSYRIRLSTNIAECLPIRHY